MGRLALIDSGSFAAIPAAALGAYSKEPKFLYRYPSVIIGFGGTRE